MPTTNTLAKVCLPMFRRDGNRNAVAGCFFHEQPLCIQKCGALADILHAGDGADEVGACKLAGDGLQLRCGIKMRGPAMCCTGGKQAGLVLFQIDRENAQDRSRIQPVLREHLADCFLHCLP